MSDEADPPDITQDNWGDENVNIGSVDGNVTIDRSTTSMFEVKRPGFEAGVGVGIVGLAVTILTNWGQNDHPLFAWTLAAIGLLGAVGVALMLLSHDRRWGIPLMVVVYALALWPGLWSQPQPAPVVAEVPELLGIDERQARNDLADRGLAVTVNRLAHESNEGTIIAQDPEPGLTVVLPFTITITVSAGRTTEVVPDLSDLDEESAFDELRLTSFSSSVLRQNDNAPAGRVIAQVPEPGSVVPLGSTVVVTVSEGPAPVVPNVVGKLETTAAADIKAAGLTSTVRIEASNSPVGRVVSQDPTSGLTLELGSTVEIIVSSGPTVVTVEVPALVGVTQASASSLVISAGLVPSVVEVTSSLDVVGEVTRTKPDAGSLRPEGSTVTLYVSSGRAASCELLGAPRVGLSSLSTSTPGVAVGGFEPALITEILLRMCGVLPEYFPLTAAERFTAIQTGDTDLTMTPRSYASAEGTSYTTPYVLLSTQSGDRSARAIAVSSANVTLKSDLDEALVALIDDGTWLQLHEQFLGTPDYSTEEMLGYVLPDS